MKMVNYFDLKYLAVLIVCLSLASTSHIRLNKLKRKANTYGVDKKLYEDFPNMNKKDMINYASKSENTRNTDLNFVLYVFLNYGESILYMLYYDIYYKTNNSIKENCDKKIKSIENAIKEILEQLGISKENNQIEEAIKSNNNFEDAETYRISFRKQFSNYFTKIDLDLFDKFSKDEDLQKNLINFLKTKAVKENLFSLKIKSKNVHLPILFELTLGNNTFCFFKGIAIYTDITRITSKVLTKLLEIEN